VSRKSTSRHIGPPSSRGAAPLDPEALAFLRALLERKSFSGELLRKRLVPPCSGASFSRAIRGLNVSVPVQTAIAELVTQLRSET
jgi:hypothetical protein